MGKINEKRTHAYSERRSDSKKYAKIEETEANKTKDLTNLKA